MASFGPDDRAASFPEGLARHDRPLVLASVFVMALLAWLYLASGAGMAMHAGSIPIAALSIVILMWWVMMIAMMLPSAAPAILLYARVRRQRDGDAAIVPSWLFMLGYLLAWLGFSLITATAQLMLVNSGALDAMALRWTAPSLSAAALIVAGAYQLSPWKNACLRQCRSPAVFISRHWRPGASGAVRLGLLHGATCVGCCWLLMVLLFVGGVMNLAWIAALAAMVAVEKIVHGGAAIGRIAGVVMLVAGAAMIAA